MKNRVRLASMKSEMHQRILSVRNSEAGFNDLDLYYDEDGNHT
jgi:hypothetical protein